MHGVLGLKGPPGALLLALAVDAQLNPHIAEAAQAARYFRVSPGGRRTGESRKGQRRQQQGEEEYEGEFHASTVFVEDQLERPRFERDRPVFQFGTFHSLFETAVSIQFILRVGFNSAKLEPWD